MKKLLVAESGIRQKDPVLMLYRCFRCIVGYRYCGVLGQFKIGRTKID